MVEVAESHQQVVAAAVLVVALVAVVPASAFAVWLAHLGHGAVAAVRAPAPAPHAEVVEPPAHPAAAVAPWPVFAAALAPTLSGLRADREGADVPELPSAAPDFSSLSPGHNQQIPACTTINGCNEQKTGTQSQL